MNGTPLEAGEKPSAARMPHFFFVESALCYDTALDVTAEEMLVYLLICCGYNPRYRASLIGAQQARRRLSMSQSRFRQSMTGLERRGLICQLGPRAHPKILIASIADPLGRLSGLKEGHDYADLVNRTELIELPMPLVYASQELPEASLESLSSVGAIRLLLHCYAIGQEGGYIASHRVWHEVVEGAVTLHLGARDSEVLRMSPEEAAAAGRELLSCGLLRVDGDVDVRSRGVLRLRHVVPEAGEVRAA